MANNTITIHEIKVDIRDKDEVIQLLDEMLEDSAMRFKKAKTNVNKRSVKANISFFASINHHLKNG